MRDGPWTLTAPALDRLLDCLGPDRAAAAREYQALRRTLEEYFDRRGAELPDVLADETLDRVARRVAEGEVVAHLRAYCYGVARRVLLEWQKERTRERKKLADLRAAWTVHEPWELIEARIACLQRCLSELSPASRDLIVRYYEGEGNVHLDERKRLAGTLSLTYTALKMRACRIRTELDECLRRCLDDRGDR